MKALYSSGTAVPFSRVLREHRTAVLPLGILLAVNILVLLGLVLPLARRAQTNEARATSAEQALQAAESEYRQAQAMREGKDRASKELETFYKQVLPADVTAARRLLHLKLQQMARRHGLDFGRGSTIFDEIRGSSLERMTSTIQLTGDYDDIRSFIHDLETSADFVVIDNLVLAEGIEANAPLSFALDLSTYYLKASGSGVRRTGGN